MQTGDIPGGGLWHPWDREVNQRKRVFRYPPQGSGWGEERHEKQNSGISHKMERV